MVVAGLGWVGEGLVGGGWWVVGGGWWVVVLTVCMTNMSVHATKRQAPNCGSRVRVDTVPGSVPV